MKSFMTRVLVIAALAGFGVVISGCHTVHGAGQDIEAGGQAIQHAAD